jgi:hypothetical protein
MLVIGTGSERRGRRRRLAWCVVVCAVVSAATTSRPAAADPPSGKEACAVAAERGQTLRDASRLLEAREELLACARRTCPAVIEHDCAIWITQLDELIPKIAVRVEDVNGRDVSDARVSVDGMQRASEVDGKQVRLDPGRHVLRAESASGVVEQAVVIAAGERNRTVVLRLSSSRTANAPVSAQDADAPAKRNGSSRSILPWTLLAIGGAALVSFVALELIGQSEYRDLRDGCGRTASCAPDDVSAARAKFVAAGISLGVGATALGAAGVLFATSTPARTTSAQSAASGASVSVALTF